MAVTPEIRSSASSEYVARAISDYLTSETGITIIFESAIVPKWKDSRISFKNVYVNLELPNLLSANHDPNDGDFGLARSVKTTWQLK